MPYKQVIAVRSDLELPEGKLAAQVAHASLEAALQADQDVMGAWRQAGATKIVVACEDEAALLDIAGACEKQGTPCSVVEDAGRTVVEPGTKTAVGVGPDDETRVDDVTEEYELL